MMEKTECVDPVEKNSDIIRYWSNNILTIPVFYMGNGFSSIGDL